MAKRFYSNQNGVFMIWWVKKYFLAPADVNSFDLITHMPTSTTTLSKTHR
jgi:hypothetical protein